MKIARGMFENAVNACYLEKFPDALDDFIDYCWVRKYRQLEYIKRTDPSLYSSRSDEIAAISAEFSKVKPKFTDERGRLRGSWSKVSISRRAAAVGMGDHYETFYGWASSMNHGDISGMTDQAEGNDIDVAPSHNWLDKALITGHMAALRCLGAYNDAAKLGMEAELQIAISSFQTAWKK